MGEFNRGGHFLYFWPLRERLFEGHLKEVGVYSKHYGIIHSEFVLINNVLK